MLILKEDKASSSVNPNLSKLASGIPVDVVQPLLADIYTPAAAKSINTASADTPFNETLMIPGALFFGVLILKPNASTCESKNESNFEEISRGRENP
jgi:hypothetical protein